MPPQHTFGALGDLAHLARLLALTVAGVLHHRAQHRLARVLDIGDRRAQVVARARRPDLTKALAQCLQALLVLAERQRGAVALAHMAALARLLVVIHGPVPSYLRFRRANSARSLASIAATWSGVGASRFSGGCTARASQWPLHW